MSVIAEYRLSADRLVLGSTFETVPDIELELERSFATDPDHPILFAWGRGPLDAFERAATDDPTVADLNVLDTVGEKRLYRIAVGDATEVVLYPRWVELGAERLEAWYADDWWHSRTRFPDRDALADYRTYLADNDIAFQLKRLYDAEQATDDDLGLTPEQRETLVLAYEMGYFDIPRGTTTSGLAEELDISNQAISERLRRGYSRLVEQLI
ncbi:helix-turn-helix domain-containing protein [Haloglomus salinum]|jgi:predicted DNA binding protein|uniref:helix-turn-helix domain-containing protein n=1 Tax=Haloglomus salinum TaxID=2962673 RepID=UPI0020C95109|nr:helix-turn-helix domain-containing protein [Haloglomus salinum]